MISNAWIWKQELKKELNRFKKFVEKTDFSKNSNSKDYNYISLKIEKFFFISSFIIRKLYESNKLSDELMYINIPVIKFNHISNTEDIDVLNDHHLTRFYNFDNETKSSLGILKLCHI